MNNPDLHVNDVGTTLEARVLDQNGRPIPIDAATILQMVFERPDKTTFVRNAELVGNGTDGRMAYLTEDGDLDAPGVWQLQGYVELPDGSWSTSVYRFKVEPNL
jgi:hypothetical protein